MSIAKWIIYVYAENKVRASRWRKCFFRYF